MKVSIRGVLIGSAVDVVASILLELPFAFYAMAKIGPSHTSGLQSSAVATATIQGNATLYVAQLLVGLACSVLGGYVAAWLARHDELLNGGLSSVLCVALGIYAISTGKDSNPHWLQMLLLAASPILAILGGGLMRRRRNRPKMQGAHV